MSTPHRGRRSAPTKKLSGISAILPFSVNVGSALPSSTSFVRKKALLIGINYPKDSGWYLINPQKQVQDFRELLLRQRGYRDENIVVLTDQDGMRAEYLPTRANILREIMKFTVGSAPGDEHIFLFSGHSVQQMRSKRVLFGQKNTAHADGDPNTNARSERSTGVAQCSIVTAARSSASIAETTTLAEEEARDLLLAEFMAHRSSSEKEEEDGYYSCVMPLDAINLTTNEAVVEKMILGDVLRHCLVLPLCVEAKLVAIFDCSHSASLLDLKRHRSPLGGTWASRLRRFCGRFVVEPANAGQPPLSPLSAQAPLSNPRGQAPPTPPLRQDLFNVDIKPQKTCSGLCGRMDPSCLVRQHVVCISACKDSQEALEGEGGESLTDAIIALLKTNSSPTLQELMQALNRNAERQHKQMKIRFREYEKSVKAYSHHMTQEELKQVFNMIEHGKVMCKLMQHPQVSSSGSLDLRRTYLFGTSDVDPVEGGWRQKEGQRFSGLLGVLGLARS